MALSYDRLNSTVRNKFGIDVTFTPDGAAGRTVKGIINRDYFSETGGVGIQTEAYILQVVDADVPELAVGDQFTINATTFRAVEIKPDFDGMSEVVLNKV
jgi:hypothetical protein